MRSCVFNYSSVPNKCSTLIEFSHKSWWMLLNEGKTASLYGVCRTLPLTAIAWGKGNKALDQVITPKVFIQLYPFRENLYGELNLLISLRKILVALVYDLLHQKNSVICLKKIHWNSTKLSQCFTFIIMQSIKMYICVPNFGYLQFTKLKSLLEYYCYVSVKWRYEFVPWLIVRSSSNHIFNFLLNTY